MTSGTTKQMLTAALVMGFSASSAMAVTRTYTENASGTNSWNDISNWDTAIPSATDDVIISAGATARATGASSAYTGTLTLDAGSTVRADGSGSQNIFTSASGIFLNAGSSLQNNVGVNLTVPNITLLGDAQFLTPFGASDHNTSNFGTITGAFEFNINGFNNHTFTLDDAGNNFTSLQLDASDRYNVRAAAVGALGLGDITIEQRGNQVDPNRSARLYLDVQDTIADTATLNLNGPAGGGGFAGDGIDWVVVAAGVDEVVAGINLYGVPLAPGTYTNSEVWLGGDGSITIAGSPPALPGDTNGDGDVDDSDLGTSFANYTGPVGDVGKTAAEGDTDNDGDVDDSDLGTSFANYTGPLSPASVPEPTSLALLGLGGLLIARRRRA